jgi:hypothetical protein
MIGDFGQFVEMEERTTPERPAGAAGRMRCGEPADARLSLRRRNSVAMRESANPGCGLRAGPDVRDA